jgi:nucleoside phosphorylase
MSDADERRPVAVVTALREELRPILDRTRDVESEWRDGLRVFRGRMGRAAVALACTGDGNRNAKRWAGVFVELVRPEALIGVGVGGSLTAGLAAGQVVFGDRIFDMTGEAPTPSPAWLQRAKAISGSTFASLLTVDRVVCTPGERRALALGLPAGHPAAVDLESAFWARAAASRNVPWLVIRAISDEAHETLPGILAACQEPGGPVRRACVARRALFHPSAAIQLFSLRSRARAGGRRLAELLETLLVGC